MGLLQTASGFRILIFWLIQRFMQRAAGFLNARKRIFLPLRTGSLQKAYAVMPACVPGPRAHPHLAMSTVSVQVFINERGAHFGFPATNPIQQGLIHGTPEISLG